MKTVQNFGHPCSKKEEFTQEHMQKGEGIETLFYKGKATTVQVKSRTSGLFITNKKKIWDRERTVYDKG